MWMGRFSVYLTGALALGATLLAAFGWGTYDPATGLFDLHPIDVRAAAGMIVGAVANLVAALAVLRGWGRK